MARITLYHQGAPVTHYDGYDTCYTERYMGLPQKNPQGYERGSVMAHVDNLEGKLLLIHGLIDENVHFRHTARLINALIAACKPYDLMIFPDERHSPRSLADNSAATASVRSRVVPSGMSTTTCSSFLLSNGSIFNGTCRPRAR